MRVHPSELLLLCAAVLWGFAFVAQRSGMEHLGPFAFNALRFGLGGAVAVPLVLAKRRDRSGIARMPVGESLGPGLGAGVILFLGAALQQVGMIHTSATNAGFITGLYLVFVPLLGLFVRQATPARGWLGVGLGGVGLFLLSATDEFTLRRGDGWILGSAAVWAVHVLFFARFAPGRDAHVLAPVQFLTCAVLSGAVALGVESTGFASLRAALVPVLYAGVVSVGIGYTLQVVAQRDVHPTRAAILMSLEGVFAAVGGFLLLGERLDARGWSGCALLLAATLVAQLGPAKRATRP